MVPKEMRQPDGRQTESDSDIVPIWWGRRMQIQSPSSGGPEDVKTTGKRHRPSFVIGVKVTALMLSIVT